MLYENTKGMIRSLVGDTNCLDIVAGILEGYKSAPYLNIC